MLVGMHAAYECKENIVSMSARVRCQGCASEVRVESVGKTLGSRGVPTRVSSRSLSLVKY